MIELGYLPPRRNNDPKVSWYYKFNFVSPEPLFAEVKEEFKTYFQTGVVDDVLFPTYTARILNKLGKGSYKIEENIFQLSDYEMKLPDNFESVREVWLVTPQELNYRVPNSCYEQSLVRLGAEKADRCNPGEFCAPQEIRVTYKTTGQIIQKFNCHYLLRPGNVRTKDSCSPGYSRFMDSPDTFDIIGNKLVTNFPEGMIYMVYYAKEFDENDYQLIPDNERVKEYILAHLKYKCIETIFNNISDETFNQVQIKLQYYEQKATEARLNAEAEMKMQTLDQQIRATKAARNRFRKYIIT